MSKLRIHDPVTGEVTEVPVDTRWTFRAKLVMICYALCTFCFGYVAYSNYQTEDWGYATLFSVYVLAISVAAFVYYRRMRQWSHINAQLRAMRQHMDDTGIK